jgi:hypothetical protein
MASSSASTNGRKNRLTKSDTDMEPSAAPPFVSWATISLARSHTSRAARYSSLTGAILFVTRRRRGCPPGPSSVTRYRTCHAPDFFRIEPRCIPAQCTLDARLVANYEGDRLESRAGRGFCFQSHAPRAIMFLRSDSRNGACSPVRTRSPNGSHPVTPTANPEKISFTPGDTSARTSFDARRSGGNFPC